MCDASLSDIDPTTLSGRQNLFIGQVATGLPDGGLLAGMFDPQSLFESPDVPEEAPPPGTPDPFDISIREAAYALMRSERGGSRQQSFVTGPRGLEGPMSNLILGGGTSLLGS